MFPSRKSGRNPTLEEQPGVRTVPSVTQTLHRGWPVSQSYPAKIGQVLGIKEELGLSAERGKAENLLLPRRASCTGQDVVLRIYIKKYNFCPHRYRNTISDEVPGIIHICIWSLDSLQKPCGWTLLLPLVAGEKLCALIKGPLSRVWGPREADVLKRADAPGIPPAL